MADKDKGYIYLYRSIQENTIWADGTPFDRRSAFIDMIFMANYKDKELILRGGMKKIIKRGQFHTSIERLAKRWFWSPNKVRRYLALLNELGMVHIDGTTHGTTVTIVNYEDFQNQWRAKSTTNETANGRADESTDGTADDRADERADGRRLNKSNTSNTSKKRKKAAPSSFYSDRPRWHIEGEYEFWLDEDGCWHRALIGQKEEE